MFVFSFCLSMIGFVGELFFLVVWGGFWYDFEGFHGCFKGFVGRVLRFLGDF